MQVPTVIIYEPVLFDNIVRMLIIVNEFVSGQIQKIKQ